MGLDENEYLIEKELTGIEKELAEIGNEVTEIGKDIVELEKEIIKIEEARKKRKLKKNGGLSLTAT